MANEQLRPQQPESERHYGSAGIPVESAGIPMVSAGIPPIDSRIGHPFSKEDKVEEKVIVPPIVAKEKWHKKVVSKLKEHPGRNSAIAAGIVLAALITFAAIRSCDNDGTTTGTPTPTPSAAAGTPRPTETPIFPTSTPKPTETVRPPTPTVAPTPKPKETPMPVPGIRVEKGNPTTGEISGFDPDNLVRSRDILPLEITGESIVKYRNFSETLEKAQSDGTPALAGWMYDKNDVSDESDPAHKMAIQFPAYAWTALTGQEIDVNGIGHLRSRPGEAVMLLVINRDKTVEHHDSVLLKHGFLASGRIWNGQPETLPNGQQNLATTEQGLVSHLLGSLFFGELNSSFVGQCNDGDNNCGGVLVVSVERHQSGLNDDGSPKMVDRLVRAERITRTQAAAMAQQDKN